MIDPVKELKIRAELLQRAAEEGDEGAVARIRRAMRGEPIARKHCLAAVAREAGFTSWEHAKDVLSGELPSDGVGTLLYPQDFSARLNHWSASVDEARALLAEVGGYLLAFKKHFFIASREFVESLGLDPDDAAWRSLGNDWTKADGQSARRHFYGALLSSAARAPTRSPSSAR